MRIFFFEIIKDLIVCDVIAFFFIKDIYIYNCNYMEWYILIF